MGDLVLYYFLFIRLFLPRARNLAVEIGD